MNNERRARLRKIRDDLTELRDRVDAIETEERDAYEALPDSLQAGDRGQKMEGNAECLSEAVGYVDEAVTAIEGTLE